MTTELPVLGDDEFRATEGRIYRHFRNGPRLEHVTHLIAQLKAQRRVIRTRLAEGIRLGRPKSTATYSHIPPAHGPASPLERALDYAEEDRERMEDRLIEIEGQLARLEVDEGRLQAETSELDAALSVLDDEHMAVVRERYDVRRRNYQIAYDLHISEATVRRRVDTIVRTVARELGIKRANGAA